MNRDDVAAGLSVAILRGGGLEIEALSLEAIIEDPATTDLDAAVSQISARREGAFGLEIIGALVVPVLIEATRQFWKAYSEEIVKASAKSAAEFTMKTFKAWFVDAKPAERSDISNDLAGRIRAIAEAQKLAPKVVEALVAAVEPERLQKSLEPT